MWPIFIRFLILGLTSFGGPAAHIGYFRRAFVQELGWIDEARFGALVALSQFLPGPGSSQLGFAIGLSRGGLAGAIAAFVGFTLPSATLMYLLAITSANLSGQSWLAGAIDGLKLLAVVVVMDACLGMFSQFCRTVPTRLMMAASTALLLVLGSGLAQLVVLALAALLGARFLGPQADALTGAAVNTDALKTNDLKANDLKINQLKAEAQNDEAQKGIASQLAPRRPQWGWLLLFALLLVLALLGVMLATPGSTSWIGAVSYQAGALVFGGGHVVLPLLESHFGNLMSPERFLTGYGAAQAIPGPMFSLATFLGADAASGSAAIGALVATLGIFLPGFLLILALMPAWQGLTQKPLIAGAIAGVNAAVVGLLLSALYQPIWLAAIAGPKDVALVVIGFAALKLLKVNILSLVLGYLLLGILIG